MATRTLASWQRGRVRVALEFKLPDFWVGLYWDHRPPQLDVWVCFLPCLPIHVTIFGPVRRSDAN